jgi:CBS domain-containing protein
MTTAREVMVTQLVTVTEQTPITESIRLLMEHRISGLPVVNDDFHLVGIVTEKDLLRVCHEEKGTLRVVGDLMSRHVRSFQQDDPFENLCDCLMTNNFRRVPILDGDKLVGLVSRADLLPTILEIAAEQAR